MFNSEDFLEVLYSWAKENGLITNNYLKTDNGFPEKKEDLLKAETLYLNWKKNDNSEFNELPKEIANLKNLVHLTITTNHLEKLPKELGELNKLEFLDLYDNKLSEIPKEIFKITSLKRLTLSNNNIKRLPIEIINCKELVEFVYDGNNYIYFNLEQKKWLEELKRNNFHI